jgi:D-alanyl-D-alanine carboxypeptidase
VLIVKSANDVAVMIAETVAGSEEAFVARMNEAAQHLGMTRTTVSGCDG